MNQSQLFLVESCVCARIFLRMDISSGRTLRSNVCHITFHQRDLANTDKASHTLFHFLSHIQQPDLSQKIDSTKFSFLHLYQLFTIMLFLLTLFLKLSIKLVTFCVVYNWIVNVLVHSHFKFCAFPFMSFGINNLKICPF